MPFALALSIVLLLLAAFQLALAFGAPFGQYAWGGKHRVLPAPLRLGSAVSILIYGLIDIIAWNRVGAIDVFPAQISKVAMWIIFGYFVLGIVINAISPSKPERYVMVPVSLLLAVVSLFIATG